MILVGLTANIIASLSLLPQIRKVIKRRTVDDMSYLSIVLGMIANILWIIYGVSERKWQICTMGIIFTLFHSLHLYIKHSSEKDHHHLKNID